MTILSAIVMLGILIFVHELGHFIFAKLMGVGVLKFSLGFGPKIIGRKIGETEYMVSAVPLGGYVKMIGEDIGDEFSEQDKERAFQVQPIWKRALIVFAGPLFNILLTYLVYTSVLAAHMPIIIPDVSSFMPVVGGVVEGSPAADTGVMAGDRIVKIGDKDIDTWFNMVEVFQENPDKELSVTIKRNGKTIQTLITPKAVEIEKGGRKVTIGQIGVYKTGKPAVGGVVDGSPAAVAGLMEGDLILKIGDKDVDTWFAVVEVFRKNPDKELVLTIKRNGETIEKQITPKDAHIEEKGQKDIMDQIGALRAKEFERIESKSFSESIYKGGVATFKMAFFIYDSISLIFSGQVSLKNVGGPVTIVKESGKAAALGILPYFLFMALFSVNLGILNLLPIPVLDGGHLLLFALEGIKGGPLNEKAVNVVNRIGLAFLLALMILAFYNDIVRLLSDR